MKLYTRVTILSLFINFVCFSQNMPVGSWIDYLPYNSVFAVSIGNSHVYGATEFGLIEFTRSDNSVLRFSKVEGLSDIGISCLDYNEETQRFFVGYSNGKIDLISEDEIISNSDLFRKTISGSKALNSVFMKGKFAYVATGFGVVKFDMERIEFAETYILGENGENLKCNDVTIAEDSIYVATEKGLRKASLSDPQLVFYEAWSFDTNIPNANSEFDIITSLDSTIYINDPSNNFNDDSLFVKTLNGSWTLVTELLGKENRSIEIYNKELLISHEGNVSTYDSAWVEINKVFNYGEGKFVSSLDAKLAEDGSIWIGDQYYGLVKNPKPFSFEIINPSSPNSNGVFDIDIVNNFVWVAPGGIKTNGNNLFSNDGVFWRNSDLIWGSINKNSDTILQDVYDFVSIKVNPNNSDQIYGGSAGGGLAEFTKSGIVEVYNSSNSLLKPSVNNETWVGVSGLDFDSQGNLWVANSNTPNAIAVYSNENEWYSYNFSSLLTDELTGDIIVSSSGFKWVVIPGQKGILVFDEGQTLDDTLDDQYKILNSGSGTGGLPSSSVLSIAEDLDGEIWVGTSEGIGVFYSPGSVFSEDVNFDAQQIIVDADGYFQYLLGTESVTAIAIDGANRKWFGTDGSGVFLMSADGTEELYHFTTDNSPLISNSIRTICINSSTGEVLFGTDLGMMAFKGAATGLENTTSTTYAYPNPVPENYSGLIAVKGLATNSNVRITDIAGNLVFSTVAEGTQVVWNGNDMNGNRVSVGVYLVFGVDSEGKDSQVAKILFTK